MLTLIMLFWVGTVLSAPQWYWWCWGFMVTYQVIKMGKGLYDLGKKASEEQNEKQ